MKIIFHPRIKYYQIGFKEKTFLSEYGFAVGKYTHGFHQFLFNGILLDEIGAFTSIAKNVFITSINHPTNYITTHSFIFLQNRGFIEDNLFELLDDKKNGKVIIGNDVWIGSNVTILPSVKIGNGAIIGAGSVVVHDVPDYAISVGNPAHVIKYRFSKNQIDLLNKSEWWNWDNDMIKKNIELFINNDKFFYFLEEYI